MAVSQLAKRPSVDKAGLKSRVRMVVAQQKSKSVANNLLASLLKTCKHVQKNKGAAARGSAACKTNQRNFDGMQLAKIRWAELAGGREPARIVEFVPPLVGGYCWAGVALL